MLKYAPNQTTSGIDLLKITVVLVLEAAAIFLLPLVSGLYTAFVLMNLWDWFVAPSFSLSQISFWMMYGLTLVVYVFRRPDYVRSRQSELRHEQRHKAITVMLNACVPAEQRTEMSNALKEIQEETQAHPWKAGFSGTSGTWRDSVIGEADRIIQNTFVLGLGFVIHIMAS